MLLLVVRTCQAIRTDEDVDIKVSEDGGYYVGWTRDDEYLRYTVDVKTAGMTRENRFRKKCSFFPVGAQLFNPKI